MTEPIIAQFMLPITTKETVQELMQKGVDWGKTIGAIEELEKVEEKIDFEEKWLKNIKMENGFISIADIEVAMSGIRSVISELKGKQ